MKTLKLQQGNDEWLQSRTKSRNASEAPAMMGGQSYGMNRAELLEYKATGISELPSDFLLAKFRQGHEAEALARPFAEKILGEELYPVVGESDDGYLRASFDGITLSEGIIWEHKLVSQKLIEMIRESILTPQYYWQLEHQLLVANTDVCLFMASDGTPDNMYHLWYDMVPSRREALLDGWRQFDRDLAVWVSRERNDLDWAESCERFREAKSKLDAAQAIFDSAKGELIELAPAGARGCGVSMTRITKSGNISYAKAVKALGLDMNQFEPFRSDPTVSYRIDIQGSEE